MSDWKSICRVDDIPPLGARRVRRPVGGDVAVFRTDGDRVFALLDRCPHKGGPLSQGIVFGEHVACPLHNWAISLEDGQARAPDVGCATKFAVRVVDGVVSLLASELATLALDEPASSHASCHPARSEAESQHPSLRGEGSRDVAQDDRPASARTIPIFAA